MWKHEYQPWWFLGSVLVGLAAGDIAFAALRRAMEPPQMPASSALIFVPLMLIIAVRERHRRFRAAWLAGAAYLVTAQVPPSLLGRGVVPLACACFCLFMGALFLSGAWAFVGRGTRLGGAALAVIAAGVRVAVLSNWEVMLRAYPGAA